MKHDEDIGKEYLLRVKLIGYWQPNQLKCYVELSPDMKAWVSEDLLLSAPEFSPGTMVEVRDYDDQEWMPKIFLAQIPQVKSPFRVVYSVDEAAYKRGETVNDIYYKQCRLPQPPDTEAKLLEDFVTWIKGVRGDWIPGGTMSSLLDRYEKLKQGE